MARQQSSQDDSLSGLSIGVGFLVAAILSFFLPRVLDLTIGWVDVGRIAAWALLTIGLAGTGIELEKLGVRGSTNLGIGFFLVSFAAGLVVLSTQVLTGFLAVALGLTAAVIGLMGIFGAIDGLGKTLAYNRHPKFRSAEHEYHAKLPTPSTSLAVWGLILSAAQLVASIIALFAG